jgi:hypothetical protein
MTSQRQVGRQLVVAGRVGWIDPTRPALAQRVVGRHIEWQLPIGPTGHEHMDVLDRAPRKQAGNARLAHGRPGVLVEPIDYQQQPPTSRTTPVGCGGDQLEQPTTPRDGSCRRA